MINDRITINRYINIHTDTSTSIHADQNERRGARRSDDEVLSECALASCDALVEHNQERVSSLKTPPLETPPLESPPLARRNHGLGRQRWRGLCRRQMQRDEVADEVIEILILFSLERLFSCGRLFSPRRIRAVQRLHIRRFRRLVRRRRRAALLRRQ